jgi:hypothetical protein
MRVFIYTDKITSLIHSAPFVSFMIHAVKHIFMYRVYRKRYTPREVVEKLGMEKMFVFFLGSAEC